MTPASTKDDRGLRHTKAGVFVFLIGIVLALWLSSLVAPSEDEKMAASEREAQEIIRARNSAPKQLPTRDAFENAVLWKTPDEVIAALGRPDYTSPAGYWLYRRPLSYDPISLKQDNHAAIWFSGGVASTIGY